MSTNVVTYDIPAFCSSHHISRALFYKLLKEKRAPRIMRVGRRTLITEDAASEWRAKMEKISTLNMEGSK